MDVADVSDVAVILYIHLFTPQAHKYINIWNTGNIGNILFLYVKKEDIINVYIVKKVYRGKEYRI